MWYYTDNEEKYGPFEEGKIQGLLSEGKINGDTPVWCKGLEKWQKLKETELSKYATQEPVDIPGMPDTAEKAKDSAQIALKKAKEATGHAITAIKIIVIDPMGGQGKAWGLLGEDKGMLAGITCVAFYCLLPLAYLYMNNIISAPIKIQLIAISFIILPPLLIAISSYIIVKIFVKNCSFKGIVFSTGIAMLPLIIGLFVTGVVGITNIEIVILATIFSLTSFCLLLNAGLMQVHKLPAKIAFWSTPLIISVLLYGCKLLAVKHLGMFWENTFTL